MQYIMHFIAILFYCHICISIDFLLLSKQRFFSLLGNFTFVEAVNLINDSLVTIRDQLQSNFYDLAVDIQPGTTTKLYIMSDNNCNPNFGPNVQCKMVMGKLWRIGYPLATLDTANACTILALHMMIKQLYNCGF